MQKTLKRESYKKENKNAPRGAFCHQSIANTGLHFKKSKKMTRKINRA